MGKRTREAEAPRRNTLGQADKNHTLNLMVAGASGQGKSTFVNNLLFEFGGDKFDIGGKRTEREDWLNNPSTFKYTTDKKRVNGSGKGCYETVTYTVQDTPGYGDGFNVEEQVFDIVNHVIQQQYDFYDQRQRRVPDDNVDDTRIDACLYFINPHRFQDIDLHFLTALAKAVSIIPIIAKADSMTRDELHEYKQHVWDKIKDKGIQDKDTALFDNMTQTEELFATHGFEMLKGELKLEHMTFEGKSCTETDASTVTDASDKGARLSPFAVICHKEKNTATGKYWPKREYPWGIAESFKPAHCDFFFLKKLLLEAGFGNLRKRTHMLWQLYRQKLESQYFWTKAYQSISNALWQPARTTQNIPYDQPPAKRRRL